MSFGYSIRIVTLNNAAEDSLGVRLGRACIQHNMPVSAVAKALGVSRQTVYSWFTGESKPRGINEENIKILIDDLTA